MIENKTRKLFNKWLQSPNGLNLKKTSADNYGTYLQNCLSLNIILWDEDGKLRKDLEQFKDELSYSRLMPNALQVKSTTKINDAKSAIQAFEKFLEWLLEFPLLTDAYEVEGKIGNCTSVAQEHKATKHEAVLLKTQKTTQAVEERDSYQIFFDRFAKQQLDPVSFYRFGIQNSVYADRYNPEWVAEQFELLLNLLQKGDFGGVDSRGRKTKSLSIRKYSASKTKSRLFLDVYEKVFPQAKFKVDGNAAPKENFCRVAQCQIYTKSEHAKIAKKTSLLLKNFQCSHVFDDRTKNPLLFEASWNVVLTPKVTDPLTGHETLGQWPIQFQPSFRNSVRQRYLPLIKRFNLFAEGYRDKICAAATEVAAANPKMNEDEQHAFIADVVHQWEEIPEEYETEYFKVQKRIL